MTSYDVLFAGAGLASSLTAYRLARRTPSLHIGMVEQGAAVGGNHTWCFHETDIAPAILEGLKPFILKRWPGQSVRFPGHDRDLPTPYCAMTSQRLAAVLSGVPSIDVITGAQVTKATADRLILADGRELSAPCVFDGRGPGRVRHMRLGFQKFLGLEVTLAAPHGLNQPIIMDATVPQTDGYRFVYVLPFSETELLIEDTYYADGFDLSESHLEAEIIHYAARKGWTIATISRREQGVLPIVLEGDFEAFWAERRTGAVPIGLAAGLFHPVTGYSVPDAATLADRLGRDTPLTSDRVRPIVEDYARDRWSAHGFYRLLNRLLFRAAAPDQRYIVLERFYRLPIPLIERFYAGETNTGDKLRVLAGKPPVPLMRAISALRPQPLGHSAGMREGILG
ncbi:hypothetical protein PB2503_11024 [Parvularcula bermudensis HTCC2503]|uniref:Lycopene cyclase n=1 Tax=Parvularcula bermudensis (strain ATCC BAA-594 / HTCC2503 / KCTC 12087) TaxID=314260 RepID=E0THV9_PARBH|nr:lycopene beta-cyclase CrtY [Parvularcula bermudensis]ADM10252.1 hypothetical protein PB2503_11024 [Parvularcula bermudensis HTCC2503]